MGVKKTTDRNTHRTCKKAYQNKIRQNPSVSYALVIKPLVVNHLIPSCVCYIKLSLLEILKIQNSSTLFIAYPIALFNDLFFGIFPFFCI